jgi:hypothetical protein
MVILNQVNIIMPVNKNPIKSECIYSDEFMTYYAPVKKEYEYMTREELIIKKNQ